MEEMDIIINFINFFRYVLPNTDLMPQIFFPMNDALFCRSLDEYFYKIICPYLNSILQKHNLSATKEYSLETISLQSVTSSFAKDIKILINAEPQIPYKEIKMNTIKTDLYLSSLYNIIKQDEVDAMSGRFQIPKFVLI